MKFDIAVVGAGIIGLTSALMMNQRGLGVALFDERAIQQMKRDSHRVYALNAASLSLLRQLNIHIPFTPYDRMEVWVEKSTAKIDFDSRLLGQSQLGAIVKEDDLIEALYEACTQQENITFFAGTRVEGVDSIYDQADLLMITDGPLSPLRAQLDIPLTQWSYRQEALVATVATAEPHNHTCYQIFTKEGPLAFLPLDHPHQSSIVWSISAEFSQRLRAETETSFNQILTEAFQQKLGAVKLLTPLRHFPLTMRHVKQYVGERWLILGDAAHTVHPMAGLGLNIGFADLLCWGKHYDAFQSSSLALQAYQRERKTEVWKIIVMLDSLKLIFSDPIPPLRILRDIGLGICDALPLFKRFFIEQATKT